VCLSTDTFAAAGEFLCEVGNRTYKAPHVAGRQAVPEHLSDWDTPSQDFDEYFMYWCRLVCSRIRELLNTKFQYTFFHVLTVQ